MSKLSSLINKDPFPHEIILVGAGGHARSLLAMAPPDLRPTAYTAPKATLPELTWLGTDEEFLECLLDKPVWDLSVIFGFVADEECRMKKRRSLLELYYDCAELSLPDPIIAHDACVDPTAKIGHGATIFHRAVVNTGATIGRDSIINTGAIIEHDVIIGKNTFIGPGTVICGGVVIDDNVYIGANCTVIPNVRILSNITIGAGSVVTGQYKGKMSNVFGVHPVHHYAMRILDVEGIYVGAPARLIKKWS